MPNVIGGSCLRLRQCYEKLVFFFEGCALGNVDVQSAMRCDVKSLCRRLSAFPSHMYLGHNRRTDQWTLKRMARGSIGDKTRNDLPGHSDDQAADRVYSEIRTVNRYGIRELHYERKKRLPREFSAWHLGASSSSVCRCVGGSTCRTLLHLPLTPHRPHRCVCHYPRCRSLRCLRCLPRPCSCLGSPHRHHHPCCMEGEGKGSTVAGRRRRCRGRIAQGWRGSTR